MNTFVQKHAHSVIGSLSGFDRLMLRGRLRAISHVDGLRAFLAGSGVLLKDFGAFARAATDALKAGTVYAAAQDGRPIQYLQSPSIRKDELAREIAVRDKVQEGLICVLSAVEPCWSFDINRNRETKMLELVRRYRKGLFYYHYFHHPRFGFMHVRLQSWLPFDIQVWINGREWLARELDARGFGFWRRGNTFTWLEDPEYAQKLANAQLTINWPKHLDSLINEFHPAHREIFRAHPQQYYWTVYQSEWATDIMFRDAETLRRIYPRLVHHGVTHFGSEEVMRFLGKRVLADGNIPATFEGEVVTDLRRRPEGIRIKHQVDWNSVKLYDKEGSVLRVETTINRPQDFKVFRPREGDENGELAWRPMRQGIADLHRRAHLSQAANDRYLDALAAVEDHTPLGELIEHLARAATLASRRVRALNPGSATDIALLAAVNRGEFIVRGFKNRDLRSRLCGNDPEDARELRRRSGRVTRFIRLLRAHGLVTKVQKTHRYIVTTAGRRAITAILAARKASIDDLVRRAA